MVWFRVVIKWFVFVNQTKPIYTSPLLSISKWCCVVKQLLHNIKINSNIISSDICEAQTYNLSYQAPSMDHQDKLFYKFKFYYVLCVYNNGDLDEQHGCHAPQVAHVCQLMITSHALSHTSHVFENLYKEKEGKACRHRSIHQEEQYVHQQILS